jgi:hypothetical protein
MIGISAADQGVAHRFCRDDRIPVIIHGTRPITAEPIPNGTNTIERTGRLRSMS